MYVVFFYKLYSNKLNSILFFLHMVCNILQKVASLGSKKIDSILMNLKCFIIFFATIFCSSSRGDPIRSLTMLCCCSHAILRYLATTRNVADHWWVTKNSCRPKAKRNFKVLTFDCINNQVLIAMILITLLSWWGVYMHLRVMGLGEACHLSQCPWQLPQQVTRCVMGQLDFLLEPNNSRVSHVWMTRLLMTGHLKIN